jgi:hypothetical protein
MSSVVFLGPTLSVEEARSHLDARYLPPVSQGDVLRALRGGARTIGIIDGFFNHVPSVWHKEILVALEQGVRVYGAASMGALRAAELHSFGMVGVGRVFEWYRDGVVSDDDEVAVAHAPAEAQFRPLSEALVNIRDQLQLAHEARVLTAATSERLLVLAQGLFFRERSYPALLRLAREHALPEPELEAFRAFATQNEPLKKRDAILLLARLASDAETPSPVRPPIAVERTFFLRRLMNQVELEADANPLADARALSRLEPAQQNELRKKTLLRTLAMKHASEIGLTATVEETQQMADDFRRARGLSDAQQMLAWLTTNQLSLERFSEVIRELATVRKLERYYALEVDARIPDHLRMGLAGPR